MTNLTDGRGAGPVLPRADALDEASIGELPAAATLDGVIHNDLAKPPAAEWKNLDEAEAGVEPLLDDLAGVVHGVTGTPGRVPDSVAQVEPCKRTITLPAQIVRHEDKPVTMLVLAP